MSKAQILQELPNLKPEDRQEIRAKLNELDDASEESWLDDGELTHEEKSLLDVRLAEFRKDPTAGSSWEEAEARVLDKLRR